MSQHSCAQLFQLGAPAKAISKFKSAFLIQLLGRRGRAIYSPGFQGIGERGQGGSSADLKGHTAAVGAERAPFPRWARAAPAAAGRGSVPGQVGAHLMRFCRPCLLEFLLRIALVMVAAPRRPGSRCRPLPSAAGSAARSRPPLRLQEVLQLVSFCFCSPPPCSTPPACLLHLHVLLLLPLCLVEVSRENLRGRSPAAQSPALPAPLPGGFSPAFNSSLSPSSSPAPSSPPPPFSYFLFFLPVFSTFTSVFLITQSK